MSGYCIELSLHNLKSNERWSLAIHLDIFFSDFCAFIFIWCSFFPYYDELLKGVEGSCRYEVFVCGDNKMEKLAVGPLEQLLPYIPGLKPLHAEGSCSNFTIQPPGKASSTAWFSKSTLNRFLIYNAFFSCLLFSLLLHKMLVNITKKVRYHCVPLMAVLAFSSQIPEYC